MILEDFYEYKPQKLEFKEPVKLYQKATVYEAALSRIDYIFKEFNNVVVSFSGGKDSGVLVNMVIDYCRNNNRKFSLLFIDMELCLANTIEFVESIFLNNLDIITPYWVCLPMASNNSLSYLSPYYKWWDKDFKDRWVRPMPTYSFVINENNNPFDFDIENITFESFVKEFKQYQKRLKGNVASLIGLRSAESLDRYRLIVKSTYKYKNIAYSACPDTSINEASFYPLYDWEVKDIWVYNSKFNKNYNKTYDLMYRAGVPLSKMRIDEPLGNESKSGISLFKIIEPSTWLKMVDRELGINFGAIYDNNRIMKSCYKLPKNHTWRSFTLFLLKTLPKATESIYRAKFHTYIKYWFSTGTIIDDSISNVLLNNYSDFFYLSSKISNRGKKNKYPILCKKIPQIIEKLESQAEICSWKSMALCIIKNDIFCKKIGFSMPSIVLKGVKNEL